jgi:hypothetical protein
VTNTIRVTRRTTLTSSLKLAGAGALAATATRFGGLTAVAQDSMPAGNVLAGLGLPEIDVTITKTGYEGLTADLTAGLYLVKATNSGSAPGFVEFMQLPEGMMLDDLMTMLSSSSSTPAAGDIASPESGGDDQGPPDWYYTTYLAGGAGVAPGATATFVIDLQPGNYVVWGEDPSAPQAPTALTVTGQAASPDASAFPPANVAIQEQASDSGFMFVIGNAFTNGSQVVEVANLTDQPHFVEVDKVPDGTTIDQVNMLLQGEMSGTPVSGGLTEADFQPFYYVGTQSAGTRQWHELSLDAGTYVIACFIGDIKKGGIPHAFEGMVSLFVVTSASGTPTA